MRSGKSQGKWCNLSPTPRPDVVLRLIRETRGSSPSSSHRSDRAPLRLLSPLGFEPGTHRCDAGLKDGRRGRRPQRPGVSSPSRRNLATRTLARFALRPPNPTPSPSVCQPSAGAATARLTAAACSQPLAGVGANSARLSVSPQLRPPPLSVFDRPPSRNPMATGDAVSHDACRIRHIRHASHEKIVGNNF
jgi:hypothetical protein